MNEKKDMEKFAKDIWKVVNRNFKDKDNVLTSAAILLKTSIELYTIALEEDSDIERLITEEAVQSIPKLRDGMKLMENPTIH